MQPLEFGDPRVIGEYRLLRRLGAGGMGRVYLGRSPGGRTVAVKVVHPQFAADEQFRERFRREVHSARQVGGEWSAPVLDADPDAEAPWIATGYVAGPTLQQAITGHGPLPEAAVRALGAGLAEALTAVHGLGLVHRDIKPSNILLTLDGPRLIDFGIARATDGTTVLTSTGVSIGSPGYMSPEQVTGKDVVRAASDVFSLGAVLVYAATGEAPFPGDNSHALLYLVVHEEPELHGLDGPLRGLVARCLAKDAQERPSTEEIAQVLGGSGGASGLLGPGWLPGPLVEEVSRSAVGLLELEPEGPGAAGPGGWPDPAEPIVPADPAEPIDPAAPVGPYRDTGAAAENASGLVPFTHAAQREGTGAVPGAPAPAAPPPPAPTPAPPDAAPSRPARIAVSARASSGPPEDPARRGRQLSCTLVLSVAGALVVALLSATFAFDLLPGSGGAGEKSADSAPTVTADPTAEPTQDTEPPSGGESSEATVPPGPVPEKFLGTWKGPIRTASGAPAGTLTVTFQQGGRGKTVGTGRAEGGSECRLTWRLTSVDGRTLHTDASPGDDPRACAAGGADEVFTLAEDGTLRYESNRPERGERGTLKRTG